MPQVSLAIESKADQIKTFSWIEKKLVTIKDIEKNIGKFTTHSNPEKYSMELKGEKIKIQIKVKKKLKKSLVCVDVDLPFKFALLKNIIKSKLEKKISILVQKIK